MSTRTFRFLLVFFILNEIGFLSKVKGQEIHGNITVVVKGFTSFNPSFFDSERDKWDLRIKNKVFSLALKKDYSDFSYLFSRAFKPQGVLSIEFANFDKEKIGKLEGMFSGCENLEEIKVRYNIN